MLHRWRLTPAGKEFLFLLFVVLIASFLRLFDLERIPVGLSGDEAADGWMARRILRGEEYPLFVTTDFGEEPMHTYLVALSFHFAGADLLSVRFVSAIFGVVTVPLLYLFAKELFPQKEGLPLLPTISAFWMATSYWHMIFSRGGIEAVTLPFFALLIAHFLWRGIRSERRWPFLLAGALLGVSLYSYRGARLLPIFLLLFLGCRVLADRRFRQIHLVNSVLLFVVAFLLFLPLGIYGLYHPDVFFARELHISIFNPQWERGSPLQAFATALVKTMGMFNFIGDPEFDRNPARRPLLDPLTSVFFLVGLLIAFVRWRDSRYFYLLLWFLVMSLPGALTAEVLPNFHRTIGTLPVVCILSALGVQSAKEWLEGQAGWPTRKYILWPLLFLLLLVTAFISYRDYFVPWRRRLEKGIVIGGSYMDAAAIMEQTHASNGVWILPATSLRPRNLPYYELYFLYDGPIPQYTLNVDETTAPLELTERCRGRSQALVIDWKDYVLEEAYLSLNSDPKGLIDFLLRKYGRRVEESHFEGFDLVIYQLPDFPDFTITPSFEPLSANFGDQLKLVGGAFGGSSIHETSTPSEVEGKALPSGKSGWVALRWQALQPASKDYKVGVYLVDLEGHVVGQMDKLLLSNYLRPTSHWEPGQVEIDYYTLPSLPGTPPGEYHIEVTVYDAETLERLPLIDKGGTRSGQVLEIGRLEIVRPLVAGGVEPEERVGEKIAPEIRLLGYDLPRREVGPGEGVEVALYWEAFDDVEGDYEVKVELRSGEGKAWERVARPVYGNYPTTEWKAGEVLRDWHEVRLGADAPPGRYELWVELVRGGEGVGRARLEEIDVVGRAHAFEVPKMEHPLEMRLGDKVKLLGYDLSPTTLSPGDTLHLTLYWQALEEMDRSYTVFAHLIDDGNHIWSQRDSIPGNYALPTTSWLEGEILADEYELMVGADVPAGAYLVEIGMYLAQTGERLPVYDAGGLLVGDRVLFPTVIEVSG